MADLGADAQFQGRWVQPSPRRVIGYLVLAVSLVGVVVGCSLLFVIQTFEALAVLVGFTNVALLTYLALSSSNPTTVVMDGPRLTVQRGREVDEFDLTGPMRRIVTVGFPNRPNWLVHLETTDGRIVELGPTQIDPDLVHAAIARYRKPTIPQQRVSPEDSALTRLDQP